MPWFLRTFAAVIRCPGDRHGRVIELPEQVVGLGQQWGRNQAGRRTGRESRARRRWPRVIVAGEQSADGAGEPEEGNDACLGPPV